jgi:hypothetical protein
LCFIARQTEKNKIDSDRQIERYQSAGHVTDDGILTTHNPPSKTKKRILPSYTGDDRKQDGHKMPTEAGATKTYNAKEGKADSSIKCKIEHIGQLTQINKRH